MASENHWQVTTTPWWGFSGGMCTPVSRCAHLDLIWVILSSSMHAVCSITQINNSVTLKKWWACFLSLIISAWGKCKARTPQFHHFLQHLSMSELLVTVLSPLQDCILYSELADSQACNVSVPKSSMIILIPFRWDCVYLDTSQVS